MCLQTIFRGTTQKRVAISPLDVYVLGHFTNTSLMSVKPSISALGPLNG